MQYFYCIHELWGCNMFTALLGRKERVIEKNPRRGWWAVRGCSYVPSGSLQALLPSILPGKALRCFLLQSVAFSLLLGCVAPAPIYRTPDIVEIEVPVPVMAPFDCQCQCQPHKSLEIEIEEEQ